MCEVCCYNNATKQYFWAKEEYLHMENVSHLERVKKYDNMENNVEQIEQLQTANKKLKGCLIGIEKWKYGCCGADQKARETLKEIDGARYESRLRRFRH